MNQQFVSATHVQTHFKAITEAVQNEGQSFVVLKHSKPAYKIEPINANTLEPTASRLNIPLTHSTGSYALDIDNQIYQ